MDFQNTYNFGALALPGLIIESPVSMHGCYNSLTSDILWKILKNYAEFSRHIMQREKSINMCQIMW